MTQPDRGPAPLDALLRDEGSERFFVHRDLYRDPEIFELEMRHIFEATWNLVGLEAEVPNPGDFLTTTIGRTPIIVSRDAAGRLHALVNSCRHKGALVAHARRGNARSFVCQYHGWAYDASGCSLMIKDRDEGGYAASFDEHEHGLRRVARLESYRGFLFASLSPEVPDLEAHLGDVRTLLDLVVDQGPHGLEPVPGECRFVFRGNWKLQLENGVDPYHFASTHRSYIAALQGREARASVYSNFRGADLWRGTLSFPNGHNLMCGPSPSDDANPLAATADALAARVGAVRARWMRYVRNLTVFPNAQIADNASVQLRIWRPIAPDRTEMRTWCLAPVGEPAQTRRRRIRQYEEFFNPSGLATPDDIANYEDCQRGFAARGIDWQQGHARGATLRGTDAGAEARALGLVPVSAVIGAFRSGDESVLHDTYRHWRALIEQGLARAPDAGPATAPLEAAR